MNLSQRQHAVLTDIGIPVWERREVKLAIKHSSSVSIEETSSAATAATELTLNGKLVIIVPEPLSSSEHNLLQAMLRCIALIPEQVDLLDEQQFSQLSASSLSDKTVWLLGCSLNSEKHADMEFDRPELSEVDGYRQVACHSLDAMLKEPRLKASAWQVLQQLAKTF